VKWLGHWEPLFEKTALDFELTVDRMSATEELSWWSFS
jgi:hypothetical protein